MDCGTGILRRRVLARLADWVDRQVYSNHELEHVANLIEMPEEALKGTRYSVSKYARVVSLLEYLKTRPLKMVEIPEHTT